MWNGTVEFELERVVGKLGMYFAAKEAGMNLSIERIDFLGVLQYNLSVPSGRCSVERSSSFGQPIRITDHLFSGDKGNDRC